MKNNLKLFIQFIIILSISWSCSDRNEDEPEISISIESKINRYLELNQSAEQPGLSIAVRKDNQIVYQGNLGLARINGQIAINSDTQFRIGSISKPITALAIMQLIEANQLSLEDKLVSFYPELPSSFANITVRHLLSHRSGLLDYIDDNTNVTSLNDLNMQEALDFISSPNSGFQNLEYEPGSDGSYSNTGYVLLALIVEKVSGMSLPDYLAQHIFQPAGMTDTFVISENEHLGDNGNNYALSFGTNIDVLGFNSLIYGASGVVSSTSDMMKFIEALLSNEFIDSSSLQLMTQTQGLVRDLETDYALGWFTGTGNYWHTGYLTDPNDFWHVGGFDGYQTILSINPDLNLEVIVLTNNGTDTREKAWDILELVRNHYKGL